MAYNVNLANFINNMTGNNSVNNVNSHNMSNQAVNNTANTAKNTSELIKNMLIGDVFTGEVESVGNNTITLRANGQLLSANILLEGNQFAKGDMLTFLVSDKSDNKLSLKTLDTPAQEVLFASKALEESNLAINKSNLDMVKGLINQNMPIDKNTLNDMAKILTKFPDADMDTLTRLYKLNMPINEDNIKQFDAYKMYEHDMTGTIDNLAEDFSKILNELVGEGKDNEAAELTKDFLALLSEEISAEDGGNEKVQGTVNNEAAASVNTENLESMSSDISGAKGELPLNKVPDSDSLISNLKEQIANNSENVKETSAKDIPANSDKAIRDTLDYIKNENVPDSEKNKTMQKLLSDDSIPAEIKSKITNTDEFKGFFEKQLKNTMFIKPEDVSDKGEVKDFYKKLLKTVGEGEKLLEKSGLANSEMAKGMNSVKTNLEFMNDLNHQMAYLQIPIKLQEGQARGDLYVYTNKKSLQGKTDDLTALLHLDMNNLGPMDIYVKMTGGNNVSTNFCLESEEMLDFIYEHIDMLSERLSAKGYNFKPTMTIKDKDSDGDKNGKVDFEKDFLDVVEPVIPISRYLFDTKA